MITKHSRSAMNSLALLVGGVANLWPSEDLEDRLIKCMMERFAIELNQRIVIVQKEYKIKWHPERALAFAVAFSHTNLKAGSFEENLVRGLINDIAQQTTMINI